MKQIPPDQVLRSIEDENTWWQPPHTISDFYGDLRRRAYFSLLYPLVTQLDVRRAVLMMGPRRVGKTVLLHHLVHQLIADGIDPRRVCYLSVDHPIYTNCTLHDLLRHYLEASGVVINGLPAFVIFDEIQYVRNWEVQLKTLVDGNPGIRFVASGSAAAALRLKSNESGAGRFTDFLLPPLTFHEYLHLLDKMHLVTLPDPNHQDGKNHFATTPDIEALNTAFVHYLNFGGYPEVIFSEAIQSDPARFIKSDIIDKVLLRDIPSLYGIKDIQELYSLFTTLAFNTAGEVSIDQISKQSGVAKNTIKTYIKYLEAAFLIKVVHRIDRAGKRFMRANFFKVYLTNPSIRTALFSPVTQDDDVMGSIAETGIFAQWFHSSNTASLHYARWDNGGEVDIVQLDGALKPLWAVEVKWSDRYVDNPGDLKSLITFCRKNKIGSPRISVTSKSRVATRETDGFKIDFVPASIYCFTVGYNLVTHTLAMRRDELAVAPEQPTSPIAPPQL